MQLRPGSDGHTLKMSYWEKGRPIAVPAFHPRSQDHESDALSHNLPPASRGDVLKRGKAAKKQVGKAAKN